MSLLLLPYFGPAILQLSSVRKKREELFPKKLVANGKEMVAKYSVSAYSRYTISFLATYVMQAIPNILDAGWERNLLHAELAWFIHQSNVCYFPTKKTLLKAENKLKEVADFNLTGRCISQASMNFRTEWISLLGIDRISKNPCTEENTASLLLHRLIRIELLGVSEKFLSINHGFSH